MDALQQKSGIGESNKKQLELPVFSHYYVEHFHIHYASDLMLVHMS